MDTTTKEPRKSLGRKYFLKFDSLSDLRILCALVVKIFFLKCCREPAWKPEELDKKETKIWQISASVSSILPR
jgi:hypothetical protein